MKTQEEVIFEAINITAKLTNAKLAAQAGQNAINKFRFECPLSFGFYSQEELSILLQAMAILEKVSGKTGPYDINQYIRNLGWAEMLPNADYGTTEVGVVVEKKKEAEPTEPMMLLSEVEAELQKLKYGWWPSVVEELEKHVFENKVGKWVPVSVLQANVPSVYLKKVQCEVSTWVP